MKGFIRSTMGLLAVAALIAGMTVAGSGDAYAKSDKESVLAGQLFTDASVKDLRVTFVLTDSQTGEVVWDIDAAGMDVIKNGEGYEFYGYIPDDPAIEGSTYEWAMRIDARDASSPVYISWFEQVVPEKWEGILGDKGVSLFPGGDISGHVELVAITKDVVKLANLKKKLGKKGKK